MHMHVRDLHYRNVIADHRDQQWSTSCLSTGLLCPRTFLQNRMTDKESFIGVGMSDCQGECPQHVIPRTKRSIMREHGKKTRLTAEFGRPYKCIVDSFKSCKLDECFISWKLSACSSCGKICWTPSCKQCGRNSDKHVYIFLPLSFIKQCPRSGAHLLFAGLLCCITSASKW